MMYRFFTIILVTYFSLSGTGSYADEKSLSGTTTSNAPGSLHKNNDSQMPDKAFDRLIKAFQAGDSGAKTALCELRAQSYDNGNIILVKKIEEHRYRNNYTCDETIKKQSKTNIKTEQTVATANAAQKAAKRDEQERQAITITSQKLATALREKQERAAADATRLAAEKFERERLAAVKAEEENALAAKAAAAKEQQQKEKMEQERLAAVKAAEEKALAAEAVRKAEEKLERERLITAIAEEKRTIASKAEQERIAAIKAAKEHQEKERIKQAQRAAEEARLAAVKQEQERIASAAAQAKKDAAAKAVTEQAAAAKASKERLAKERAEQIQAAVKTARLAAEKQERERIAAAAKDTAKMTVSKAVPKPPAESHAVENRKPNSTPPRPGQPVPGLNVTSFSGMPVSPDYYRGSVLLIDFFAPWCQICRRHIPNVVDLHSKFKKQGLQVLGLSVDNTDKGAVANFSSELHMTYLTAQADDVIQAKFGVKSVPTVYIVDKKGRIAGVFHTINDETDRTIESMVKKLLVAE